MFPPILPRPIIPSFISNSSFPSYSVKMTELSQSGLALHSLGGFHYPIAPDQVVGRAVMSERRVHPALQFRENSLSQHLAQLDSPLVERIDAPDHGLCEDDVLVQCN